MDTPCLDKMLEIPKVEINYNNNKQFHLDFVSMKSKTFSQPGKYGRNDVKMEWNDKPMKCKEFSFHELDEKPQTAHGFRRGRIVEQKVKQSTGDFFYEEVPCTPRQRTATEDFTLSGQKVNLQTGDETNSNVVPPREWVIEKSRTLPDIKECLTPYSTPIKLYKQIRPKIRDKLNVSTESLASIDILVKETEPKQTNKEEFNSKKSESDSLPKINDASSVDTCNQSKKGISVSLQTDDYLYYNTDDNPRPTTTSQGNRPVRYKPLKIMSPTITKKLPNVHKKKSLTSREAPRRRGFPNFRAGHNAVYENATRLASKQSMRNLSTSLPVLTNPNM